MSARVLGGIAAYLGGVEGEEAENLVAGRPRGTAPCVWDKHAIFQRWVEVLHKFIDIIWRGIPSPNSTSECSLHDLDFARIMIHRLLKSHS